MFIIRRILLLVTEANGIFESNRLELFKMNNQLPLFISIHLNLPLLVGQGAVQQGRVPSEHRVPCRLPIQTAQNHLRYQNLPSQHR